MYNRYIPQPDGSYRRSHQPDRSAPPKQAPSRQNQKQCPCPPLQREAPQACVPAQEKPCRDQQDFTGQRHDPQGQSITQFFRQLLPKGFDTADLLIVLLLILMTGDNQDEQNNALLTLALYLFM